MTLKAKAPKLEAALLASRGHRLDPMPRSDWDALCVSSTGLITLDPFPTPIAQVVRDLPRVAVVGHRKSELEAAVSVYRYDPEDAKPWNADHYSVFLDVCRELDIPRIAVSVSTSYNANMVDYLSDHVHWRKEPKTSTNHWFQYDELPPLVQSIVGSSS